MFWWDQNNLYHKTIPNNAAFISLGKNSVKKCIFLFSKYFSMVTEWLIYIYIYIYIYKDTQTHILDHVTLFLGQAI